MLADPKPMPEMPNFSARLTRVAARVVIWLMREDAQGLTEYALILALIAIVALTSLHFLGGKVNDALSTVGSSLQV